VTRTIYHFTFRRSVPLDAVEDALLLAVIAGEALHGDSRDPDTTHVLDETRWECVLDARTKSGAAALRVFTALVASLFGPRAFRVVTAEDLAERRTRDVPRRGCRCGRAGARR